MSDVRPEMERITTAALAQEGSASAYANVLVVKEALEIMFAEGHTSLTIGSCCLHEFKKVTFHDKEEYAGFYPDLYEYDIDEFVYGSANAGEYIRKSYKGGWCYVVKGKECKKFTNGTTADVNSLYPSMMSSESGNIYPYLSYNHKLCNLNSYLNN